MDLEPRANSETPLPLLEHSKSIKSVKLNEYLLKITKIESPGQLSDPSLVLDSFLGLWSPRTLKGMPGVCLGCAWGMPGFGDQFAARFISGSGPQSQL